MARNKEIKLRLSDDEYAELEQKAKKIGCSKSDILRQSIKDDNNMDSRQIFDSMIKIGCLAGELKVNTDSRNYEIKNEIFEEVQKICQELS